MEIKINVTGIEGLTESIALLASAIATDRGSTKLVEATEDLKEETKKPVKEVKEKKAEGKEMKDTSKAEKAFDSESLTIENVRAAFMAKNSKANKPKLKSIIESFGVSKLTDIPEKDFPKALEELEAL